MKRYPGKCWFYYPESRQELKLTCFNVLCLYQGQSNSNRHLFYHFANVYAKSGYLLNFYCRFFAQRAHSFNTKTSRFAILAYNFINSWSTCALHSHPDLSHKNIVCLFNLKVYQRINLKSTPLSKMCQDVFPNMPLCRETNATNYLLFSKGLLFLYS